MISCKHCQSPNAVDAKFCKSCGLALPEDAIREATEKHEKLVSEGYALYNAGRTEEAISVAHAAVEESPTANALSLLGMCLERSGDLAQALECFERVLMIQPDSALDRIKVNQLRGSLTNQMRAVPVQNRRTAIVASICAGVLILCVGGMAVVLGGRKANAQTPTVATLSPDQKTFTPETVQAAMNSPQSAVTTPPPNTAVPPPSLPTANQASTVQRPSADSPSRDQGAQETLSGTLPVKPDVPPDVNLQSAHVENPLAEKLQSSADPQPKAEAPATTPPAQAEPPKQDEGTIEISVSKPRGGSADTAPAATELEALMRTAQQQMMIGRYQSAARSYERALQAGGDSARINQKLGMCYEKLGRANEAVSAYARAASAYQGEIDSGRGDSRRLKSGLESCKQAIRLLKG